LKFFKYFQTLISISNLKENEIDVIFYSEGENYWPYFAEIIKNILNNYDLKLIYISSSCKDPGLNLKHENLTTYLIDKGAFRNSLFRNFKAKVVILTIPELGALQLPVSKYKSHYIYIQHSLISLTVAYTKHSFNHFNTIFCSGPHHFEEVRATENFYKLTNKNLIKHGYSVVDKITTLKNAEINNKVFTDTILIAPTCGKHGLIENLKIEKLIKQIINFRPTIKIIIRPHPETLKHKSKNISLLKKKYVNHNLIFEENILNYESLLNASILITDWSGVAFDFAFGLRKKVIFINEGNKIRNNDFINKIDQTFEFKMRNKIGYILTIDELSKEKLNWIFDKKMTLKINPEKYIYNFKKSDQVAAAEIFKIAKEQLNT